MEPLVKMPLVMAKLGLIVCTPKAGGVISLLKLSI